MANDLEALLALQADDLVIHGFEQRLDALEPRITELDVRRQRLTDAIDKTNGAVTIEEKKQAHLRDKIAEHKQLIERNQHQMDTVQNMKQATAAVAQMDAAKKIVAGEESDLLTLNRKLDELRATGKVTGNERLAILTALNIAHEHLQKPGAARSAKSMQAELNVDLARSKIVAFEDIIEKAISDQEKLF